MSEGKSRELTRIVPLSIGDRWAIYSQLNLKQRELIDDYRKYLIRSEFLKNNYLKASDWRFVDLKIDMNYEKGKRSITPLYCECGRQLKYQYIVRSKLKGTELKLGRQHFKDHLGIPTPVVSEITEQINNVDFGLDELLTLYKEGYRFPKILWESYQELVFQDFKCEKPTGIDLAFTRKIQAFEEADMPLYLSDIYLLESKIKDGKQLRVTLTEKEEEWLCRFKANFRDEVQKGILFDQTMVWATQVKEHMTRNHGKVVLPERYFQELYDVLSTLDPTDATTCHKKLTQFSQKGMGKWLQPPLYSHMAEALVSHGLSNAFFLSIHPIFREGLKRYNEKKSDQTSEQSIVEKHAKEVTDLLSNLSPETRQRILQKLLEETMKG